MSMGNLRPANATTATAFGGSSSPATVAAIDSLATATMASEKMSVQDRIRALNLQQQVGGGGGGGCGSANTPPRRQTWHPSQQSQRGSFRPTSPARPSAEASSKQKSPVAAATPAPETSSRSVSKSPPSEKAQLFKAAKVIKKSFNAEADIMNRNRAARAAAEGRQREKSQQLPQWKTRGQKSPPRAERDEPSREQQQLDRDVDVSGPNPSNQSEDSYELDASAALSFWKMKGITSGGPMSYKEMMKKKSATVATASPVPENVAQRGYSAPILLEDPRSHLEGASRQNLPAQSEERGHTSEAFDDDRTVDIGSVLSSTSTTSDQHQGIAPGVLNVISSKSISIRQGKAAGGGGEGELKLPSPPEIVRTVNADSDMEKSFEEENDEQGRARHRVEEHKPEEDQHVVHEQEEKGHDHEQVGQGDAVHKQGVRRGLFEQHEQDSDNYNQKDQEVYEQQEEHQEEHQEEQQGDFDASDDFVTAEQSVELVHKLPEKISKEAKPSSHLHSSMDVSDTGESDKSIPANLVDLKSKPLHGHGRSKSVGGALGRTSYRAYARRSRLRTSPRATSASGVTSPDLSAETMAKDYHDAGNALSIVSAGSASAMSQASTSMSQVSSLSSRATRYLKDKKDKRKQGGREGGVDGGTGGSMGKNESDMARDIAQNILRGRASKERIKQRAHASGTSESYPLHGQGERGGDLNLQLESPFDEDIWGKVDGREAAMGGVGRPRTIDLKPAMMPKIDPGFSGINRDIGGQQHAQWQQQQYLHWQHQQQRYQQQQQHAGMAQQQHSEWQQQQQQHTVVGQTAPAADTLRRDAPPPALLKQPFQSQAGYRSIEPPATALQQQQQMSESRENPEKLVEGGKYFFEHAPPMDSSSYSELKARDFFVTAGNPPPQRGEPTKAEGAASFSPSAQSEAVSTLETGSLADAFATFPQGEGKSFDNGCQVLEAINPLIESAFNAIGSAAGPGKSALASDIFGSSNPVTRRVVSTAFCNAPSDEEVAIEVEYVEQGEERSYTEMDSIYSLSTRDMESD